MAYPVRMDHPMPIADAIADAETLELFYFQHDWKAYHAMLDVGNRGFRAGFHDSIRSPTPAQSRREGRIAARHAFRLVPTLR